MFTCMELTAAQSGRLQHGMSAEDLKSIHCSRHYSRKYSDIKVQTTHLAENKLRQTAGHIYRTRRLTIEIKRKL